MQKIFLLILVMALMLPIFANSISYADSTWHENNGEIISDVFVLITLRAKKV